MGKFTFKTALFLLFLVTTENYENYAQVGVGTETPLVTLHLKGNPQNNSQADGILPPTITKLQLANKLSGTYTAVQEGTLVYVHQISQIPARAPSAHQVAKINIPGVYFFNGTQWILLEKEISEFKFVDFISVRASEPVERTGRISNNLIINDVNIGMSVPIVVPPRSVYKIHLIYSIPASETSNNSNVSGYLGIRFLKNNEELQIGSRKMALPPQNSGVSARSVHIGASFTDELINNTNQPQTYTYTLNGYIQPTTASYLSTYYNVRFNMWTEDGYNYNWGYGNVNLQIYGKSI